VQRGEARDRHGPHSPQAHTPWTTTASPGAKPVTPAPTRATVPATSCPSVNGGSKRITPGSADITCRSEWQIPVAVTRTSSSPAAGTGTGTRVTRGGTCQALSRNAGIVSAMPFSITELSSGNSRAFPGDLALADHAHR
jgi:hypothetical protein